MGLKKPVLKRLDESGVSLVELILVIGISSTLLLVLTGVSITMYGNTIRSSMSAQLANESQLILRTVTEELRQSSAIRAVNANPDTNAPGGTWTTSNSSLILIIATPVLDQNNNFVIDPLTSYPYQNEIVYYADGAFLYKRYIAHPSAPGNVRETTCPQALSSGSCPADILLSNNFKTLSFVFYDQDDTITDSIPAARSIQLAIMMERKTFGKTINFDNSIRITIRNNNP